MSLTAFTIDARPGHAAVTVAGQPVEALSAVLQLAGPDTVPVLTVHHAGEGTVTGEGVVQVVRDPTQTEIDAAALDVLSRVDVTTLEAICTAKVQAGRRDPYRVAVETLVEMARG